MQIKHFLCKCLYVVYKYTLDFEDLIWKDNVKYIMDSVNIDHSLKYFYILY